MPNQPEKEPLWESSVEYSEAQSRAQPDRKLFSEQLSSLKEDPETVEKIKAAVKAGDAYEVVIRGADGNPREFTVRRYRDPRKRTQSPDDPTIYYRNLATEEAAVVKLSEQQKQVFRAQNPETFEFQKPAVQEHLAKIAEADPLQNELPGEETGKGH